MSNAKLAGILLVDEESEMRYGYASQRLVNMLIERENVASRIAVRVDGESSINRVQRDIQLIVGESFKVEQRSQLNPTIYQIIRYEKMGIALICGFVMMLASFSLLGALTMLIIEKSSDIGTLRAMGATHSTIKRIFLLEALLISGAAIVGGSILGIGVTLAQEWFGFVSLPSSTMMITTYPVKLLFSDVVGVVVGAAIIASTLSYMVINVVLQKRLAN